MSYLIAGSPPISLSLIVGRSKCDAEASVTRQTFFFSQRKSPNPHPPGFQQQLPPLPLPRVIASQPAIPITSPINRLPIKCVLLVEAQLALLIRVSPQLHYSGTPQADSWTVPLYNKVTGSGWICKRGWDRLSYWS